MPSTSSVRSDANSARHKQPEDAIRDLAEAIIKLSKIVDQLANAIEDLRRD